jgi:aminoglycoside phosphotransferase (APT) family kinase protein
MVDELMVPPGLTPLAEGREAEVYLREDGYVVKVMRSVGQAPMVEREAAALQALAGHDDLAPIFKEVTIVEGRPALVSEWVNGADFLTLLSSKPWLVLGVASSMGRAHAAMHSNPAPVNLPGLAEELSRHIESAKDLPRHLACEALHRLGTLPSGDRLCHGDFHPANILGTLKSPVIIDWGSASQGPPAADVARTLLLLRMGELPPNTPAPMRALTAIGRGMLTRRYQSVYRRESGEHLARLDDWIFVRVAARFDEGIEVEFPRLSRLLEEARTP